MAIKEIPGQLRRRRKGGNYHYILYLNGKLWERSTGESNYKRATKKAKELYAYAELQKDTAFDRIMLSQAIVREVARVKQDISEGQSERVSSALTMFLEWLPNDIPLDKIDTALIEEYQRHRLKTKATDTVNKDLNYLLRMLRMNGFNVKRPSHKKGKKTEQRAFNAEELKKFFEKCPEEYKTLFLTMLATGARPAELIPSNRSKHVALLKKEIDKEKNTITIRSAKMTKDSPSAVRILPLPHELMYLLEERAKKTEGVHVFPSIPNLARIFNNILGKAKIEKKDILKRKVTAHSFRHTYATMMAEAVGHNPFILQKVLGHSQITTTSRYCHASATETVIDITSLITKIEAV